MSEYIERPSLTGKLTSSETQSAMREMDGSQAYGFFLSMVNSETAADVVEVRHERWEWGYRNGQYGIWCTHCGTGWVDSENAEWIAHEHDFCPNCGAKMDGGADNG